MADVFFTWVSAFRIVFSLLFLIATASVLLSLPIEKMVKGFLFWVKEDLGQWGPFVLALSFIPLTILVVPASILTCPSIFGLAYIGTTIKDLSDVTHGWNEISTIHQVLTAIGFCASGAKATLEKALAVTNAKTERFFAPAMLPIVPESHTPMDAEKPLLITVDSSRERNQRQESSMSTRS